MQLMQEWLAEPTWLSDFGIINLFMYQFRWPQALGRRLILPAGYGAALFRQLASQQRYKI
jgi:hypothetical protein